MNIRQPDLRSLLILVAANLLAACAPVQATPTVTPVNVEAIYTSAAQTVVAQISQTAAAQPSATPTPTVTLTMTTTITPTASKTKQTYYAPLATAGSPTTTGTPGPTATATFGAVGCNDSAFLADSTIPNGTVLPAGKHFTKTWLMQNTGTCDWTYNYKFWFIGGDVMGSDTFKIRRTVGASTSYQMSVDFIAPNDPGTYTGYWRMADDKGILFGTQFEVSIKVEGATYTPTVPATPSNTPLPETPTNTSEPSITPTASSAPVPSNTPTPTDTATPTVAPAPSDTPTAAAT